MPFIVISFWPDRIPTQKNNTPERSSSSSSEDSTPMYVGIGVGVGGFVIVAVAALYFHYNRQKQHSLVMANSVIVSSPCWP